MDFSSLTQWVSAVSMALNLGSSGIALGQQLRPYSVATPAPQVVACPPNFKPRVVQQEDGSYIIQCFNPVTGELR